MAKQNITVSIDKEENFYVENLPKTQEELEPFIESLLANTTDGTVKLHADKTVQVQSIVYVIDAVNHINQRHNTKHKVILATSHEQ